MTNITPTRSCCCNCSSKLDAYKIFEENVEDISKSLTEVMLICGISTCKARKTKEVIRRVFVYHEKLRTKCHMNKANHLVRDDLLEVLTLKCDMNRTEAMLTYSIVKRAFKAFFHGKSPIAVSNPILDAEMVLTQEKAWKHAAYKTARIFDNYRVSFFWAHRAYELQIRKVYDELYNRMKMRASPLSVPTCSCRNCASKVVPGALKSGKKKKKQFPMAACKQEPRLCTVCGMEVPEDSKNRPWRCKHVDPEKPMTIHCCEKCNSPKLMCACNIDRITGDMYGECGQDSYKVKWHLVKDSDEESLGSCNEDPLDHHCPIDCKRSENDSDDPANCFKSDGVDEESDDGDYCTCDSDADEEEEAVAKLEQYLNKLWREEKLEGKTKLVKPIPQCAKCESLFKTTG